MLLIARGLQAVASYPPTKALETNKRSSNSDVELAQTGNLPASQHDKPERDITAA